MGGEEATERRAADGGRVTRRIWWIGETGRSPPLMQWRKGTADGGKTAPEKSQGWKGLGRWLPPSGYNFSVV